MISRQTDCHRGLLVEAHSIPSAWDLDLVNTLESAIQGEHSQVRVALASGLAEIKLANVSTIALDRHERRASSANVEIEVVCA